MMQVFNPTAELAISKGLPINGAKVQTETLPVKAETKISECLM